MKTPSFLSPYLDGDSPTRLFQGLVVGVVGVMLIGFNADGWTRGKTVDEKVAEATQTAFVTALAPICANKFEKAAESDNSLVAAFSKADSWNRDGYLKKAGWVTFPGGAEPNLGVADACADLLKVALKLK
ncbi:hypothetical protein ACFL17_06830 [Pseudomonadota bacterium]